MNSFESSLTSSNNEALYIEIASALTSHADCTYLAELGCQVVSNIVSVLDCSLHDISDIFPLKEGLTNSSCHFRTPSGEYVYRHPGIGTEHLIDRKAEAEALLLARELQLDGTFVHQDASQGWKISRFLPHCRQLDPQDPSQVARAMRMARSLHTSNASVKRHFDFQAEADRYEAVLLESGPIESQAYHTMMRKARTLRGYAAADNAPVCLTHNDFFNLNLLIDETDRIHLIDWEYAGMSDYANDFGTFTVCCQLSDQEALNALDAYFGRPASFEEKRHCFAFVALAGWCWYVWCLVKELENDDVGEWKEIYHHYAASYMDKVLNWYENDSALSE